MQNAKRLMERPQDSITANVFFTEELDKFKTLKGNRVPNLQHVRRLVSSVETNGMLPNPIIINENYEVIDGQHRLMAAKEAKTGVYYIVFEGSGLTQVQILNLNQKNWQKKDFMNAYAKMGIESYIKIKDFYNKNNDFGLNDCISLCSNNRSYHSGAAKYKKDKKGNNVNVNVKEIFEEGTWKGKDFKLGQEYVDKLRLVGNIYSGYNNSRFIGTMIGLFQNDKFDFNDFMHKLRIQPTALVDCKDRDQYRSLIEDIYNYRRRDKVNLRY
jgi:hypothetical protein